MRFKHFAGWMKSVSGPEFNNLWFSSMIDSDTYVTETENIDDARSLMYIIHPSSIIFIFILIIFYSLAIIFIQERISCNFPANKDSDIINIHVLVIYFYLSNFELILMVT